MQLLEAYNIVIADTLARMQDTGNPNSVWLSPVLNELYKQLKTRETELSQPQENEAKP